MGATLAANSIPIRFTVNYRSGIIRSGNPSQKAIKDRRLDYPDNFGANDRELFICGLRSAFASAALARKETAMQLALEHKRWFASFILLVLVLAHCISPSRFILDWPSIFLLGVALCLLLAPQLKILLPFVKAINVGETEIHLREQAIALAVSVEQLEATPSPSQLPAPDASVTALGEVHYKRLLNTSVEAHILDLSGRDKQAALMRLAIEIEKEVLVLHGALGLRNQYESGSFRSLVEQLLRHGAITDEMKRGLMEFWHVRNQIAHFYLSDDALLTSALDSGLRLLRLVKTVPRQRLTVIDPHVVLFKDPQFNEAITDYHGVMLEIMDPEGKKNNSSVSSRTGVRGWRSCRLGLGSDQSSRTSVLPGPELRTADTSMELFRCVRGKDTAKMRGGGRSF